MTDLASQDRNTRLGIRFFLLYAAFYLAYVLVNAFAAEWAEWKVVGGLNLAVVWGFALIAAAFLLAVLYGSLCSANDKRGANHARQQAETRQ